MSSRNRALRARKLSVRFDDVVVFDGVDVDVVGVVGVVGENGAGKSCFCAALAEFFDGDCVFVAQLDDDPDPRSSPGQRQRRRLRDAFARRPRLLILDEPTNHLDDHARGEFDVALDEFVAGGGAVVVASHDRGLLDARCTTTVVLHRGEHLVVSGNASLALDTWERVLDERRGKRRDALRAVAQTKQQLAQARSSSSTAEAQRSTKTRMRNAHDSDARTLGAAFRVDQAAKRLSRNVQVKRRAVERAEAAVDDVVGAPRPLGRAFFVDHELSKKPRVASVHGALVVPGTSPPLQLCDRVDVDVGRSDRLRIAGKNGSGKTTLLRALCGLADDDDGADDSVLWLPQEIADAAAPLRALHALPRDEKGRALQAVAALGIDPTRLLSTSRPSSGEAKKLLLALAFARRKNGGVQALFLDEPTNHLDLPSVRRLAEALRAFPGAVVVVSHDDAFVAEAGVAAVYDVDRVRGGVA